MAHIHDIYSPGAIQIEPQFLGRLDFIDEPAEVTDRPGPPAAYWAVTDWSDLQINWDTCSGRVTATADPLIVLVVVFHRVRVIGPVFEAMHGGLDEGVRLERGDPKLPTDMNTLVTRHWTSRVFLVLSPVPSLAFQRPRSRRLPLCREHGHAPERRSATTPVRV